MYDKIYYPYPSTDNKHKYLIITDTGKKIRFGDIKYEDFTQHKDEERKKAYINRHKKREDWTKSGINTKGWWSKKFLWSYPTKEEAYKKIKEKLLRWGYI